MNDKERGALAVQFHFALQTAGNCANNDHWKIVIAELEKALEIARQLDPTPRPLTRDPLDPPVSDWPIPNEDPFADDK